MGTLLQNQALEAPGGRAQGSGLDVCVISLSQGRQVACYMFFPLQVPPPPMLYPYS